MLDFNVEGVKPLLLQFKKSKWSKKTVKAFTFANIIVDYGDGTERLKPNDIVMLEGGRMFVVVTVADCNLLVRLFNTSIYDYLLPGSEDFMVGYGYLTGEMTIKNE